MPKPSGSSRRWKVAPSTIRDRDHKAGQITDKRTPEWDHRGAVREVAPYLVVQEENGPVCRWFTDADCDLFAWSDSSGALVRFQLCLRKGTDHEHSIDWLAGGPLRHGRVDDGETATRRMSPLVEKNGPWEIEEVREAFRAFAQDLPEALRDALERILFAPGP